MRLTLSALIMLILTLALSAQAPIVKFYYNYASLKRAKNISDIDEINFIKSNLPFLIVIFQKGSINEYNVKDINSINFIDSNKLQINLTDATENFNLSDIDSIIFISNTCTEITIGTQTWMCKNLDVSTYRNGDTIPQITDPAEWHNLETGAWCYYNNDPANGEIYGKLYNWYAVNDPRGLAPVGWHIPSDTEWTILADYLGGRNVAGGKLIARGTYYDGSGLWRGINYGYATNESGFSALPGGYCSDSSKNIGYEGYWWTSTEYKSESVWYRFLRNDQANINISCGNPLMGLSVRCVKD